MTDAGDVDGPGAAARGRGPVVRNAGGILTPAGTWEAVSLFPAHMTRCRSRPDIAYVPVRDIDALRCALVWRAGNENGRIRGVAEIGALAA